MRRIQILCLSAAALSLAACSESTNDNNNIDPVMVEEMISAATGGVVEAEGLALDIPANALASDTTITVEVKDKAGMPNAENIAGSIYELGPDGLTFEMPVTLTLSLGGASIPAQKRAVIAFLDGSSWVELADSSVEATSVVATTTHFTAFAIVIIDGVQVAGSCDEVDFTPCGGDLEGSWSFALGCYGVGETDDLIPECTSESVAATVDISGSVTFGGDGGFSYAQSIGVTYAVTIPNSCLPQEATCMDVAANWGEDGAPASTYEETATDCVVTSVEPTQTSTGTGTFVANASAGTITFNDDDTPGQYCVQGDVAMVREVNGNGATEVLYVLERN
jgi:hypothetical protein